MTCEEVQDITTNRNPLQCTIAEMSAMVKHTNDCNTCREAIRERSDASASRLSVRDKKVIRDSASAHAMELKRRKDPEANL